MKVPDLPAMAEHVCQIAQSAGQLIMDIYQSGLVIEVEHKSDQSPLTLADQRANELICRELQLQIPSIPIISEENKAIPYAQRKHFDTFWLIDPLDGTKEFIKRNGEFTVNIALIQYGKPVLGVVYVPANDTLYFGIKYKGAFEMRNETLLPLQAKTFRLSDKKLRLVCSRSHLNEATEQFVHQFDEPELIARGSSLKFLALATGQAHLYPRLAPTMEWDTAAAQIILEEAGGSVIDQNTQQPLRYNKESLRNPHFVAYGARH